MHAPPVTTNTAPHLNQKKTNKNRAQTTTTRARSRSPPPTMGRDQHNLVRRALLTSTLLTLTTATSCHLSTSQLYHLPDSATMTICMRSLSVKTRAAKADAFATLRPCRRRCSNSRSPRSKSINAHLAELNLPRLRFDGGLEVLRKGGQDNVEHLDNIKILSATKNPGATPP